MSSVPEQLGQYEILGPIGAGGMGEVYVARDPTLGRRVAIKVLPLRLSADRDNLTRFTQEARSASALNHPNIVTIHEVGSDAGTPYIVMEHIDGKDLRSYINEAPIPSRKLLDIAAQIAEGLAAAHEQRIVHRDLKPENIMVTKDGYVKILDFGLAKIIRPAPDETDVTMELEMPGTTPGTILGTVGYMSPEQATGRPLDFRSDQFALGAILYELATGKAAFDGETAIDTLSGILHDDPEPIHKTNPRAPAPFCWIVGRLLSKSPNDRYTSTRDLAHELRAIRDRVATEGTGGLDMPFGPPDTGRRKPLLYVGLAVALAAALAFVADRAGVFTGGARGVVVKPTDPAPSRYYLAVLPFNDLTGDANGQLVVDGFAETLTTRLSRFPAVQIMRSPAQPAPATKRPDMHKVAADLGASHVLIGSMQRAGQTLRVNYSLYDARSQKEIPGDLIDGGMNDLFALEDRLAESVANDLKLGAPLLKAQPIDVGVSQRQYLEALGLLRRYDNESAVDRAIYLLENLATSTQSASVQAALAQGYLAKYSFSRDPKLAESAAAASQRAAHADPQNPDVHITLGEVRRATGKFDDAVAEYKRALAVQPNSTDAILGLAETYRLSGRLPEAERAYQQGIELQPQLWSGYNKLGVFYITHGRYSDAVKMFETVIRLVPDNVRAYNNLGAAYQQMGRYDDAVKVFSQSLQHSPTADAYSNLGTCMYFLGRYRDAANAYEQATALSPRDFLLWANLADAYRSVPSAGGQAAVAYDKAISLANAELKVNPKAASTRTTLAVCLAKRERFAEAEKEIATARSLDPSSGYTISRAALIANLRGDTTRAISTLREAVQRGYSTDELEHDPEFANLRGAVGFKEILKVH
jgi:tetratricopeptide (TPR) repeat protein